MIRPSEYILRDSRHLIVRQASLDDAEEILSVVKEYIGETEFIPYVEGEFNPSLEDEKKWIQSFNTSNSLLLLAEVDGKIVGNISVNGMTRKMMSHASCIGIGILKEYRGLGIGSFLFEKVLEWAKENPVVEILWLETYATNRAGLALYGKMGFKEIGRHPDFVKLSDTEYVDNVKMTLKVK